MFSTKYFIFVNLANLFTRHNLKITGQILSSGYASALQDPNLIDQYLRGEINYLPFVINEQRATVFLSFYCTSITAGYRVEYEAEMRRLLSFPQLPSRLSAVYAFASEEDCREAHRLYSTFYFYEVHLKVFNSLLEKGFGRIKRCNQA